MNVVLAIAVSILYVLALKLGVLDMRAGVAGNVRMLIHLNFILAGLNLIPVPPLDGGAVLAGILPDRYGHIMGYLQQYGFLILLALLMTRGLELLLWPVSAFARAWLVALHLIA
jgi:Zn-dependent protease